jgi:hypothetical protein
MRRNSTLFVLFLSFLFTGCVTRSYFLSPFNGNSNPYYAKPLMSDSLKSAVYATGVLTLGSANEDLSDEVSKFSLSLHRSHTFKYFQAYYGGSIAAGLYDVSHYKADSFYNFSPYVNVSAINSSAGTKYFSGASLHGGMNMVVPMSVRHEWRILGVEASLGREWGDYLDFRNKLPDSASDAIWKTDRYGTIGLTTEMAFKTTKGSWGFKLARGISFYRTIELGEYDNNRQHYLRPSYFSAAFHVTRKKYTGFAQLNAGSYAANFQLGLNYRLGRMYK